MIYLRSLFFGDDKLIFFKIKKYLKVVTNLIYFS